MFTKEVPVIVGGRSEFGAVLAKNRVDVLNWPEGRVGKLFDEVYGKGESRLVLRSGFGEQTRVVRYIETTAAGVLYQNLRLQELSPDEIRAILINAGVSVMGKIPLGVKPKDQLIIETKQELQVRLRENQVKDEGQFRVKFESGTYPGLSGFNLIYAHLVRFEIDQYRDSYKHLNSKGERIVMIWKTNILGEVGVDRRRLGF